MNKKDTSKTKIEIDLNTILLEELLISIGGVLFAGAEIQEIDTPLLSRLEDLIQAEVLVRKSGLIVAPTKGETMH
jgi:hypothetical protein